MLLVMAVISVIKKPGHFEGRHALQGDSPVLFLRRQRNSKAELVRTLKTYVSRRSMFPFFFFLSKIVHFLIEIDRGPRRH